MINLNLFQHYLIINMQNRVTSNTSTSTQFGSTDISQNLNHKQLL